jgi:hypothetical protein
MYNIVYMSNISEQLENGTDDTVVSAAYGTEHPGGPPDPSTYLVEVVPNNEAEVGVSCEHGPTYKLEVEPARALEAFMDERLLARVLENARIERGVHGPELSKTQLEEELEYLEREGLSYASSTLLVPGVGIPLYHVKSAGWLFDGAESEIQHVASSDSGSSGGTAEDFFANQTDFESLSELASFLRAGPQKTDMNEVNAKFSTKGLLGVVVRKAPSRRTLLEGIITHKYMLQKGYNIPLFVYDQDKGEIEPLDYNDETVKGCLEELVNEKIRVIYDSALAKLKIRDSQSELHKR